MATIQNAINMQDRMTPVFNKMLAAMQKTLSVMEGLDQATSGAMSDTSGIKQAQAAINAARNDVIKMQNELDALNNKHVNVAVNVAKANAQQASGFTDGSNAGASPVGSSGGSAAGGANNGAVHGVSAAQVAAIPPASIFVQPNTPQGVFAPLTREAEEANAAAQKLERSINGIRAPNDLASAFSTAGSQGSYAGRVIAASMAQARENASKVNVESLRVTKAMAGVDYQAVRLGSNSFGQQMQEQLKRADMEAEQLEQSLSDVNNTASRAGNSMKLLNLSAGINLAKQAWQAVSGSAAYLDNLSQIQARLGNINDGSQTTAELEGKILAAANRSRANYQTMADSVAKLNLLAGEAFGSNDEAIAFAEQINKMFVVSGTSAQEASAAMYQLNQALASGRLQGDEFRSIIENAPMLANAIADSMGVSRAELKELSSDGAITASVIKKAMADCADDVNAQFAKMPMTFGQAMNLIQNEAAAKMQAVANSFSEMINGDDIQIIADAIGGVITSAALLAIGAIKLLSGAISFLSDNMAWIAPIAIGLATAFGLYTGALIACKIATIASTVANGAHALSENIKMAATWLASDATLAETAAQWGLNAALLACPLTWIILALIALIALVYIICGALNTFAGTSISATGVVAGVFFALGAIIYNVFMACYNVVAWFVNWFARIWNNPEYAAKSAVGNIAKGILDMCISGLDSVDSLATSIANAFIWAAKKACDGINWIIDGLNKIPGVDIDHVGGDLEYSDSALAGQIDSLKSAKTDIDSWIGTKPEGWDDNVLDYGGFKDIGQSYQNGYNWGQGLESDIGNWFDKLGDFGIPDMSAMGDTLDAMKNSAGGDIDKVGKVGKVGKIENDVELSDEDIKMLKDIASTKYINKFTTLQPNMSVTFGDVHETADLDEIMDAIETMTEQALAETILEE